jgi:hypothetical protein
MHKKVRKISKDYNKIAEKALKSDSQMNEMKANTYFAENIRHTPSNNQISNKNNWVTDFNQESDEV